VGIAVAARWRPAGARGAVARSEQDSGAEDRAGPEERMTRGWGRSRRWMAAAYTALPITIKAFISLVI
jgi:hypothetical protein